MSRSDEYLRAIIDAMPLLFFHKDTRNRILLANKAAAEPRGTTPEEMVGTDTARWYPDEAEAYYADDLEVIRSGRPKLGIVEPVASVGDEKHWVSTDKHPCRNAAGEVTGLFVFVRDATAQALAQTALRRNEAKLRSVLEAIPDAIYGLDAEGRFTEIFTPDSSLPPVPTSGIVGRSVREVFPDPLAERFVEVIGQVVRSRELVELEYSLEHAGSVHWQSARVVYLESAGRPGVLWTARDVTRRKQAEENRMLLEARIRDGQKLESLGLLAGGVAHDFNNLLVGILGNASLAREDLPADSPAGECLADVEQAARRAAELCEQMLAFSGQSHRVTETVDLSSAVSGMERLLGASIARETRLVYELADTLPGIEGDPTQLRQVCMNLVTNASEALGDEPGTVTLATGEADCDADTLRRSPIDDPLPPGRYVYLEVSDTGRGMDAATQEHMFEPFFTTRVAGRGLGLAATLGIVRAHGGAILVDSEPGQGTCIRVLFPARAARPAPAAGSAPSGRNHGAVLVTDDDETVRKAAGRILSRAGFAVLLAGDGAHCLDMVRRRGDEIACVLLDLTMPGMGGEECLRALRRIAPQTPVLLSSGRPGEQGARSFAGGGASGFLQKPYAAGTLIDAVAQAVRGCEGGH